MLIYCTFVDSWLDSIVKVVGPPVGHIRKTPECWNQAETHFQASDVLQCAIYTFSGSEKISELLLKELQGFTVFKFLIVT